MNATKKKQTKDPMKDATPGPWKARDYFTGDKITERGIWVDCDAWTKGGKALGGTVAEVYDAGDTARTKKNALLIAAAPDMLAALEEAKAALLQIPAAYQPARLLNVVNAAISKARNGERQ